MNNKKKLHGFKFAKNAFRKCDYKITRKPKSIKK